MYISGETFLFLFHFSLHSTLCSTGPSQGLKIRGGHVILGGDNVPSLVEIGLTTLPKSGGARTPPTPPLATGLRYICPKARPSVC